MDIPSASLRWRNVAAGDEADMIVAHWLGRSSAKAREGVPFEQLADAALGRAAIHFRGEAHARQVAEELRSRAYAADLERANRLMPGGYR
jgi:hypothetical protein